MQPAHTEIVAPPASAAHGGGAERQVRRALPHGSGPFIGLVLLCMAGVLLNPNFATAGQRDERADAHGLHRHHRGRHVLRHRLGRHRPVGRLDGGADRGLHHPADERAWRRRIGSPALVVALGMAFALLLGALFGLAHGLLITKGKIEPFIVTLGTLGIFRAYLTYFANGGAITLDGTLSDAYSPVYYGAFLGDSDPGLGVHRAWP